MKPDKIFPLRPDPEGLVPNNPNLPLLLYRAVFASDGQPDAAQAVVSELARNHWQGGWVNGIFPYHHYHARAHEVLVNLADAVTVQFGGPSGPELEFATGDVVVIPAGVGHCRLSSPDRIVVVGAYPAGCEDWDLKRADPEAYRLAQTEIPLVPLPDADPITGKSAPLRDYWS